MSMPNFPEVNPEITRERALDMILASIAMEELALSHIINAEGEKLQYVLGTLETGSIEDSDIDEVLAINQSVACLLDSVSQNQMLLKSKMEKVLKALPDEDTPIGPSGPTGPQGPTGPTGPACKCPPRCSAVFKGDKDCKVWNTGCSLPWDNGHIHGECVRRDPCDDSEILLCSNSRYMLSFAVNVRTRSFRQCDIAVSLQIFNGQHHSDVFTFKNRLSNANTFTVSMGGIIVDSFDCDDLSSIHLKLLTPDSLTIENSMLSIMEI